MLLFKENARERERERRKSFCWFLIRDWIKDVCSHNSITLSFCPNSRGRRRRRRRKKRKRGYILSSSPLRYAQRTLLKYKTKKAQNCSGASLDDERRKKKKTKEDIYTTYTHRHTTYTYKMKW